MGPETLHNNGRNYCTCCKLRGRQPVRKFQSNFVPAGTPYEACKHGCKLARPERDQAGRVSLEALAQRRGRGRGAAMKLLYWQWFARRPGPWEETNTYARYDARAACALHACAACLLWRCKSLLLGVAVQCGAVRCGALRFSLVLHACLLSDESPHAMRCNFASSAGVALSRLES